MKRIIIMKADTDNWYHVGDRYEVIDDTGNEYIVKDKGQLKRVYKKDCEVV